MPQKPLRRRKSQKRTFRDHNGNEWQEMITELIKISKEFTVSAKISFL